MVTKTWWEVTKREPSMMHSPVALLREGRWQISEYEQQGNEEPYRKYHAEPFATKLTANREVKRIIKERKRAEALFQISDELGLYDELM